MVLVRAWANPCTCRSSRRILLLCSTEKVCGRRITKLKAAYLGSKRKARSIFDISKVDAIRTRNRVPLSFFSTCFESSLLQTTHACVNLICNLLLLHCVNKSMLQVALLFPSWFSVVVKIFVRIFGTTF